MKRIIRGMVTLAAFVLAVTAWAEKGRESEYSQLRVELDLSDGSRIIGVPDIESVPVQTSYAKMDVPLKQILTLKIGDDHETAAVDLRNGDKVKGVVNLEPIKLETVFGKVTIGVGHIRELRVVLGGGALPEALKKGLVLYYSFDRDEGGKVTDGSGKRNNGEVKGATWTAKGKVGGAYDFDGKDDFIELGPSDLYKTTGRLSACAWVSVRGPGLVLLSNYHGGGAYSGQFFFACGHGYGLDVAFGQASGAFMRYLADKSAIAPGGWRHVAFSYDESRGPGAKIKLYVDGKEVAASLIQGEGNGGPVLDIGEKLRIMAHRDTPTGTLSDGLVDEVMLFDRALTGEEVRQIYDAQK